MCLQILINQIFNSAMKSNIRIVIPREHNNKMCFHINVQNSLDTKCHSFIYFQLTYGKTLGTYHLASIRPQQAKHQKMCVCLCVSVCVCVCVGVNELSDCQIT